ncbi:MAG: hypothetical protein WKF81_00230 [Thermomicrobiales bacterium]
MRRLFGGLLILIVAAALMLPGSMTAATLQESTPVSRGGGDVQPGEPVSYISESGSEIATLQVTQVVRPWDEFDEFYEPTTGTEYVAFQIEVTHLGRRGDLVIRGSDFRLQDVDGFLIGEAFANAVDDAELAPTEDDLAIPSGETMQVVVVFQIIEGIDLSNLYWLPEYDRMITVADLSSPEE